MKKLPYEYEEADKYVVLNDNDPDLRPIVLSLPKPPPLHLIDGYGLPPEEQRFQRLEIPRKLIDLEAEAVLKTKEDLSTNKNNVVTLLKIQKKFWELLRERHKSMKKEIAFIRRFWWFRVNGYWTFIKGKPYWISPWHFFYLNVHTMNTDSGTNRPDFRHRDWKEYIFAHYCLTTTETFERLDEDGYAIAEPDGSYKMIDVGRRVCYGKMQPKNRRSGNTNKGISNGLEYVTRSMLNHGMGIQSFSNQNAKETFDNLLMPAFDSWPIWLKPNTTSGRTSDALKFNVGKNEYGDVALQTQCTYATTASEKFYDSKKMMYLLIEESGKTSEVDIAMRHEVSKNTLSQGNGRLIHGYCDAPSTVSEVSEGAAYYRALSNTSNFYRRIKSSGQTYSGIFRLFIPATEGLDGFIDSYGFSVKDKIEDYQRAEGFTQTAEEYLRGKRDSLQRDNSSESQRLLREEKKLFPLKYEDCWLGEAGSIGFNIEKIDAAIHRLRRHSDVLKGRLEWVGGIFGGDVEFVQDEEHGRFTISEMPPDSVSNRKIRVSHYSTFEGKNVDMWRPMYPGMYTLGADPFKFGNKQDEKVGMKLGKKSRLSDGGIAILRNYDKAIDGNKSAEKWDTYKFVLTYRFRAANTDEYNEDVIKAAIFFGASIYPETNIPATYEYVVRHRFGGYLLYDIDKYTGRVKDKPGVDSLERSKQEMFALWRDYIENRSCVEQHMELLKELKDIRGMEEMRHYDLLAAGGVALLGAKSAYTDILKRIEDFDYDYNDFIWT